MKIDEMFNKYPTNIIGFRVNGAFKMLDFWLDPNWEILDEHVPESVQIKKQKVSEETGLVYYVMYAQEITFETLFDLLTEVIEYNVDLQRKQELFTQKMGELKGLFTKLSYDELTQLSFDTPMSITPVKKGRTKKSDQEIVTPTEDSTQPVLEEEVVENEITEHKIDN